MVQDRISQLPDPLICQILSLLPTKEAVKTSVLSTRWTSLWLWVPSLDLNRREFPYLSAFVSFGERFFDSDMVSSIDTLKISLTNENNKGVEVEHVTLAWIDAAVKRKVKHLHVLFVHCVAVMPLSLYTCETLASLNLGRLVLPNAEFFSLPCLKTLHIYYVRFHSEVFFESLISSCPVLEELEIEGARYVYRVVSRSLKSLSTKIYYPNESGVVIDAPRLSFLSLGDLSNTVIITNMGPNVKLLLKFLPWHFDEARLCSFLPQISKFKDMIMDIETFRHFYKYSKRKQLPQFIYMSCLRVSLRYSLLDWLPTFLGSFPNLKSFTLVCYTDNEVMHSKKRNSHVPECLTSSLEFVDIKVEMLGFFIEMKLVRYFLENSAVLKKLTLQLNTHLREDEMFKQLFEIPKASTKCEVVIVQK